MAEIKAIETYYNGYRFRSRLEARWAVFFDAMDIEYQYEPEGFVGLDDTPYLPDFYLPNEHIFVEVKGTDEALQKDADKIMAAIDFQATPISDGLIILGDIPNPDLIKWGNIPMFTYLYWERGVCIEYAAFVDEKILLGNEAIIKNIFKYMDGYADYFASGGELPQPASTKCKWTQSDLRSFNFYTLQKAYETARQARFEHGERPITERNYRS